MNDPQPLAEARAAMHLPTRALSRWVRRSESSLRQMEGGSRPIPPDLAIWFAALAAWVRSNPPPAKTR